MNTDRRQLLLKHANIVFDPILHSDPAPLCGGWGIFISDLETSLGFTTDEYDQEFLFNNFDPESLS